MRRRSAIFLITPMLALGCASSANQPQFESVRPDARIAFVDPALRAQLQLSPIALARDDAHLLHASVPVRSSTDLPFDVNWRITWLDANGIPLGPPTSWSTAAVAPGDWRDIIATSWTPRAADVRLELRYAQ